MKKPVPFTPFCFDKYTHLYSRKSPQQIVEEAGAEYIGFQRIPSHEGIVLFMDSSIGTTLGLPPSKLNYKEIKRVMRNSRLKFQKPGIRWNLWNIVGLFGGTVLWVLIFFLMMAL